MGELRDSCHQNSVSLSLQALTSSLGFMHDKLVLSNLKPRASSSTEVPWEIKDMCICPILIIVPKLPND